MDLIDYNGRLLCSLTRDPLTLTILSGFIKNDASVKDGDNYVQNVDNFPVWISSYTGLIFESV